MPLAISDQGSGNRIEIDAETMETSDGSIVLSGSGNLVSIAHGVSLQNASISLGSGCALVIGQDCRVAALELVAKRSAHVRIGADSNFTWHTRLYLHEPGRIEIGEHCLIASDVLMTISDMHSIIDRDTGQRINPARDIVIGDQVWLAHSVTVMGGSHVGQGAIVGLGSVVTGTLENYTLSVGRPARTIRSNVTWDAALR